jgi:signal transduction histidine kinase
VTKRLLIVMATLVAVVSLALAIPLARVITNDELESFVAGLQIETLAAASVMSSEPDIDWQSTADSVAEKTGARVVVVDLGVNLVADSGDSGLDRVFQRPEIEDALVGQLASDVRYSDTLVTDLRYVAAPIVQNYEIVAAVRLSLSETDAYAQARIAQYWLALFVASVVSAAAFVAWLLSRSITRPVIALTEVVEVLPTDLDARADEKSGTFEIKQAAVALNKTASRLQGIVARTSRVAADASHHLRTPLTGIRLRLEAISDLSDRDDVRADADAAIEEVDRLGHRIDQILALTRADSGATALMSESLGQIATDRIAAASVLAVDHGIEITSELIDCAVMVPVGTSERIIDELLSNAFDYARTTIHIQLTRSNDVAELSVRDDGPGIDEGTKAGLLFDRFYRGKSAVPGGSGLGLALVAESARACGGDARAVNHVDPGGLEVVVSLPCAG